jgi:hypothetical protein
MSLNCLHGDVVFHIGHLGKQCSLTSVQIHSLVSSANLDGENLVVATIGGFSTAVQVWNRTGRSNLNCYPPGSGTNWNWTAVPFYSLFNLV